MPFMKYLKICFAAFAFVFLLGFANALDVSIDKKSKNEVHIRDLGNSVVFDLEIFNEGESREFEIFSTLDFVVHPSEKFFISSGESKVIRLEVFPRRVSENFMYYKFDYYIRSSGKSLNRELIFKTLNLEDVFSLNAEKISLDDKTARVFITNEESINFENIFSVFSSPFFSFEEKFNLDANEEKSFVTNLNREDFSHLEAGFYTMFADLEIEENSVRIEGTVNFEEENIFISERTEFGFFVSTGVIENINKGNVVERAETVVKKNVISRLFTTFSPEPDVVEREGLSIYYTWIEDIRPGESSEVRTTTNWFFPFLIVLFLVLIVVLTKKYTESDVELRKKVSFVNAKGGEFALKVTIFVKAKKHIERINIFDRLPSLVELYERFGENSPSKVDKKNRRIEWTFDRLDAGEKRVLSYVIYSKVGVLGKFALPSTTAVYEKNSKLHETESNRAFFVTEPRKKDLE